MPVCQNMEEVFGAKGDTPLQIGDTIALCIQREGHFFCVSSEGFVELSTTLREVAFESTIPWTFIDCQWVVTNKFQYDAQKKLRQHLKAQRRAKAGSGVEGTKSKKNFALTPGTVKKLSSQFEKKKHSMGQTIDSMLREKREATLQEMQRQLHADLVAAVEDESASNSTRNLEKQVLFRMLDPRTNALTASL